jgi:hypothetical protein
MDIFSCAAAERTCFFSKNTLDDGTVPLTQHCFSAAFRNVDTYRRTAVILKSYRLADGILSGLLLAVYRYMLPNPETEAEKPR